MSKAREAVAHLQPAVIVTGGSRGLGLALAERFCAAGYGVVLVARHEPDLSAAATAIAVATGRPAPLCIPLDVTRSGSPNELEAALSKAAVYADVLINNAGIGQASPFVDADPERLQHLLDLNISALTALCRHFLPAMRARGRGGILNVASLGGAVPGPGQAAYYASKSYVLSLTEALAAECAGEGVRISALAPGPLDTNFHNEMGAEASLYRLVVPAVSLRRTARVAMRGWILGRRVIVPGVLNQLAYAALRILPHPLSVALVKALLRVR